jgi:long-subunit acyl-CoA synthetase (AMP-forming)
MIRGACVMKEYYKNPTVTAATIKEGGWLHTGDLAKQDEDGFVFITGRLKELIIKGGELLLREKLMMCSTLTPVCSRPVR